MGTSCLRWRVPEFEWELVRGFGAQSGGWRVVNAGGGKLRSERSAGADHAEPESSLGLTLVND